MSLTVSPIRDATGRVVGASKIARDVTARKQAEATQRQLLEELNHRVRNTLATIQAIAGQSLRRAASPEAFVRSFGGRVQALARVHDLLVAGEMAGVDLAAILEVELGPGDAARGAAEGPAVMLEPRMAVQMALVLHELAENARRHGALARPGGGWRSAGGSRPARRGGGWCSTGASRARRPCPGPAGGSGLRLRADRAQPRGQRRHRGAPRRGGRPRLGDRPAAARAPAVLPARRPGASDLRPAPRPPRRARRAPRARRRGRAAGGARDRDRAHRGRRDGGRPGRHLEAAARLIEAEPLDAALLDANLAGRPVDTLAAALDARGVPFAFASGYGPSGLPEGFRDRPLLGKPFGAEALVALVGDLLTPAGDATVIPLRKRD